MYIRNRKWNYDNKTNLKDIYIPIGELRNVLHVTLREIKDDFNAEELCLMFIGSGMSGLDCNRDIVSW